MTAIDNIRIRQFIIDLLQAWDDEMIGPTERMHRDAGGARVAEAIAVFRRVTSGAVGSASPDSPLRLEHEGLMELGKRLRAGVRPA